MKHRRLTISSILVCICLVLVAYAMATFRRHSLYAVHPIGGVNACGVTPVQKYGDVVCAYAFSTDGRSVYVCTANRELWLVDTTSLAVVRKLKRDLRASALGVSPDGKVIAIANSSRQRMELWSALSWATIRTIKVTSDADNIKFVKNRLLVLNDWGSGLCLSNEGRGTIKKVDLPQICNGTLSPDGSLLAIGGLNDLKVYDTMSWTLVKHLHGLWRAAGLTNSQVAGNPPWVRAIAFSSNDQQLFAGADGNQLVAFSTRSWKRSFIIGSKGGVNSNFQEVAISSNGKEIATDNGLTVSFWDATNGRLLKTYSNESFGGTLAFCPYHDFVATLNESGTLTFWGAPPSPKD